MSPKKDNFSREYIFQPNLFSMGSNSIGGPPCNLPTTQLLRHLHSSQLTPTQHSHPLHDHLRVIRRMGGIGLELLGCPGQEVRINGERINGLVITYL